MVVDASAVLELLLATPLGERVGDLVLRPAEHLHAPHLADIEVVQALRRLSGHRHITAAGAAIALRDFQQLAIELHAHRDLLGRIWELRAALTASDATYVALAEALGARLITCDVKLARSNGHRAHIELVEADA